MTSRHTFKIAAWRPPDARCCICGRQRPPAAC